MKASFNPLFAERTFSTTVTIKARCSSETDAYRSMSVSVSGTPGSSDTVAGARHSFKGIRLPASRIISGCKPYSSGRSFLTPEPGVILTPEPGVTEAPPSGNSFLVSYATCRSGGALRDDTSRLSALLGEEAGEGVSLSIISGRRSPEDELI